MSHLRSNKLIDLQVSQNTPEMITLPGDKSHESFRQVTYMWSIPIRAKKFRFNSILSTESIFSIRFGNLINLPLVH